MWDEFYHLKERISDVKASKDLVVVEYDLKTFKKLGPIEKNVTLWRKTILELAKKVKVLAIDCGVGEENIPEAPKINFSNVPLNIIFPLYAAGISTSEKILKAEAWKPQCLDYYPNLKINYGHTIFFIDLDGVVRKVPVQVIVNKDIKDSLAIVAVQRYGRSDVRVIEAGGSSLLLIGSKRILLEKAGTFRPEFIPESKFNKVSFIDIVNGKVESSKLKDKLVLVGINLPNWGFQYLYPLSKQKLSSSLVLQANAMNSLLLGRVFSTQTPSTMFLLVVVAVLALSVVFARTNVLSSAFIAFGTIVSWFLLSFFLYLNYTLIDTVILPLGILLCFAFVHAFLHAEEVKEKQLVEGIFGRYLKPEIVQRIVENPEKALESLKGTTRVCTVLFADIRGFTTYSEKRRPEEVVKMLNLIFEKATEQIFTEDGMVDKFIGDGIMVLFNIPDDQEDHADRAVRASIKIMRTLREMALGLMFGIGIHTGEVVAGNIGSSKRMDYTAIGDTVNTASRICSIAKAGEILISEETRKALKTSFKLEYAGEHSLKGKSEKVKLYRVIYDYN